jgi:hypothetical protein
MENQNTGYGLDFSGAGCGPILVVVFILAIIVAGLILVPQAIGKMDDAAADRALARAAEERARTDRAREDNLHREQMYMLWTSYIQANSAECWVGLAAFALGLVAFFIVRDLVKEWIRLQKL